MMVLAEDGTEHPIHLNKNEWVLSHFQSLQLGQRSYLSNRWCWDKIGNHIHGYGTYYFTGAAESSKLRTMFMIDVDCKTRGTREGADAFLKYIATEECREKYGFSFPRLFHEVSTGGVGGHGFPLLDKDGMPAEEVNKLLFRRLQPWLRNVAREERFDIEVVEIKGTLPQIKWGQKKFEALHYQSGTLAKLPRNCVCRFEDLKNTTVVTPRDLQRLPLLSHYNASSGFPEHNSATKQSLPNTTYSEGSCSGKHFSKSTLAGLTSTGRFQVVAEQLLAGRPLKTSGRTVVTVTDVAIFLMIGEFFTKNMPTNGAMPTRRWSSMWTALFDSKDIERAFDPKRFKSIRDYLSSLSLIQWESAEYKVGRWNDGKYIPGMAAKWTFNSKLLGMLSLPQKPESLPASIDNEEKEEHPLWEQILKKDISKLVKLPKQQTICPVERSRGIILRELPEEIVGSMRWTELIAA